MIGQLKQLYASRVAIAVSHRISEIEGGGLANFPGHTIDGQLLQTLDSLEISLII